MLRMLLIAFLPFLVLFGSSSNGDFTGRQQADRGATGTIEKMVAADGNVVVDIDLNRLHGRGLDLKTENPATLQFGVRQEPFFTAIVFDGELRAVLPSTLAMSARDTTAALPEKLKGSFGDLVIEAAPFGSHYELSVRDAKGQFTFFNIEGFEYGYDANLRQLSIRGGRLLLSREYAEELDRPSDTGVQVGTITAAVTMRAIEITRVENGEVTSDMLPANENSAAAVPGPDVVVGDLNGLHQPSGSVTGNQVGLAVGTDACNFGNQNLNWFALPNNDHPVIPQNMYRMSGGPNNDERFEQIGQSSVKHAYTALTQNICNLGCNGVGSTRLGSGCSDPYSASLNAGPSLGSRAWINPFSGEFPSGGSSGQYTANNHTGHNHSGAGHRILTNISDLTPAQNPGATYYAEAQYVTPHEYTWCQANPGQCNMYNNVSYRRYSVSASGASTFSFAPVAATVREKAAVEAWPGSTMVRFEPAPGADGVGFIAYKVTNPSAGVWHYEYAVYNQNLDRAIQSFAVAIGSGAGITNIGFHAPPQHPGNTFDGTVGNQGYSSTPWASNQTSDAINWATETLAQNANANAIRWGTMYNFRFDSNRPPAAANATVGFFKTGEPINVEVMAPSALAVNVSVGGRVATTNRGIAYAKVSIDDGNGNIRTTYTNSFGYYRFDNVMSGQSYTISVQRIQFSFAPQVVNVNGNLANVDFFDPLN